MGFQTFATEGKNKTKSEDIGNGQIELRHLAPSLFAEIQKIALHNHSGVGSRKVRHDDIEGAYGKNGFILYSNDGTKRYRIQIDNSGVLTSTEL